MSVEPKTRLELLMRLTGVTGKTLAGAMHIDMSLLSRWKNGKRKIQSEIYLSGLARYFVDLDKGKYTEILRILTQTSIEEEHVVKSTMTLEGLYLQVGNWLKEDLAPKDLYCLKDFKAPKKEAYFMTEMGNIGRRKAVLSFLEEAVRSGGNRRLLLISNEEMSWLLEDGNFTQKWAEALKTCILSGCEITIIHTISRSVEELYQAFMQWIPFYLTGKVQAYYLAESQIQGPLHTLFILEDLLVCQGYMIDHISDHRYTMLTNDVVTVHMGQILYQKLLESAVALNYIYHATELPQIAKVIVTAGNNKECSHFKADELFITTMERTLLEEILIDNQVDERSKQYCMIFYDHLTNNFQQNVQLFENRHIYNLDRLNQQADQPKFRGLLLSIMADKEVWISRKQFIKHLEGTIKRLEDYENYTIALYHPENTVLPLENMDFWVKEGYYLAMWSRQSYRDVQMSHEPMMVETISRFYNRLWGLIPEIDKDKRHVTEHLKKLLLIAQHQESKSDH